METQSIGGGVGWEKLSDDVEHLTRGQAVQRACDCSVRMWRRGRPGRLRQQLSETKQHQGRVGHDRVTDRCAGCRVRIVKDGDEFGAVREVAARRVRVVRKHFGADDQDQIVTRQRRWNVLRAGRFERPLDCRLRQRRGVGIGQEGLHGQHRPHLLAGGDDQRAVTPGGVDDRAHRITHSDGGVQVHQGRGSGQLGVGVGHADRGALVQRKHVVDVGREIGQKRHLGRPGVAEHRAHAKRTQQLPGGAVHSGHHQSPSNVEVLGAVGAACATRTALAGSTTAYRSA